MKNEDDGGPVVHLTTLALVLWSAVIAMAGMLPLDNFVGHPHWERIQWTVAPRLWRSPTFYFDVVANIGLFYPFGVLMARRFAWNRWTVASALVGGGVLFSLGIEYFQVYCHNRHPSPIDLLSNTIGTTLGVVSSRLVFTHRRLNACLPAPTAIPPDRTPALASNESRTAYRRRRGKIFSETPKKTTCRPAGGPDHRSTAGCPAIAPPTAPLADPIALPPTVPPAM